ncbi:hypothetical protein J2857_003582 [Neorhizobium galegae]|uniref:hypothetical protein n=1 Tax=Neorhizobium galegae TaxID=399 RepID=UPI001AE9AFBF|nr:hypothetical protein [Neorhizobium galegae]MBP2560813.1 hypothetical protein [Neorhizobium galegae]
MVDFSISPLAVLSAFADRQVKLPLRLSDNDVGVILDDLGADVITIDVNSYRSDADAEAIAALLVNAVNHVAGLKPWEISHG